MFDCAPGALVPIPQGSWHVTYVLQGPAVVANVYSAMVQPPPEPAPGVRGKYFNSPPVRVGLRCASGAMLSAPVPSGGPVSVRVSISAAQAVPDLLAFIGFSIRGDVLVAQTVMRKE